MMKKDASDRAPTMRIIPPLLIPAKGGVCRAAVFDIDEEATS
jgi:hypothetical protein